MWIGEYFECINVTQPDWNGKYCFLGPSTVTPTEQNPFGNSFKYGICMPNKCSSEDIAEAMNFGILFNLESY
jgi:hypothetical protein